VISALRQETDPVEAWTGGIASAILIGAFAGLMPAVRASRLPPTVALRTA
jgi:putative ABC transport system permease protein